MKRDLQENADNTKSPYSLKRNIITKKTSKSKLNDGLIFMQKAPKINRFKNFLIKMKIRKFILRMSLLILIK